ncbi:transcriptional regulator GcvA [Shimia sp.]|uniref:transcriptional regulator GcvA n=1 Tax=Shimia sp. TaxID=1954381 RepID=UPI003B8D60E4
MNRKTYPLNALRAFEASARHLSFVAAAEELSVTPAAISHQVKKLEDYLGCPLFRRRTRGLVLVETGQLLAKELHSVFLTLDQAMEHVMETDKGGSLALTVAPTFAAMWLIPRLQKFYAQHPDIDVLVSTSLGLVDFQRDDFDAAIRLGHGQWPGLEAIKLFDESVIPMCSPRLLEGQNAIREPSDLKTQVLLHNQSMDFDPNAPTWQTWLDASGTRDVDATRGMQFSLPDHGLQAAIDGAGVVLGWRFLSAKDVQAGRVVELFDLAIPLGSTFYLVYPEAHSRRPNIVAFREWVLGELKDP